MSDPTPRYSTAVKAEAIALAAEVGSTEAGRRLDIKAATIRQWVKRAGDVVRLVDTLPPIPAPTSQDVTDDAVVTSQELDVYTPSVATALAQRGRPWQQRAATMTVALDDVAAAALAATQQAISAGRGRDARDLATTVGILIDKAALIGGRAQRITESHHVEHHVEHKRVTVETDDDLRRQVEALRRELGMSSDADVVDAEVIEEPADER